MSLIDPIRAREDRAALATRRAIGAELRGIARRLDSEAAIADRPGQLERLEAIARELRTLAGGAS